MAERQTEAERLAEVDRIMNEPRIYRIIRFRQNGNKRTIKSNVTLSQAQEHCRRDDTHGVHGGVRWFDGYDYMRGCSPKKD